MNVHATSPFSVRRWDGQPISEAGAYAGIGMDEYHGNPNLCDGPSISSSGLRTIWSAGAAAYWVTSPLNPLREKQGEKEHFSLGRAAHTLLLGEEGFRDLYAIRPKQWRDWRTNAAKDWRAEQLEAGRTVITAEHFEQIRGMAGDLDWQKSKSCRVPESGLANCQLVQEGLLNGEIERTLVAKDEKTGIWLRGRPDCIPTADGIVVDLKTYKVADLFRSIWHHGYHMQGAIVGDTMKPAVGIEMTAFVLLFIQVVPPFAARPIELVPHQHPGTGELIDPIAIGRAQNRQAIDTFARCLAENAWPATDGRAEEARMPDWYFAKAKRAEAYAEAEAADEEEADDGE